MEAKKKREAMVPGKRYAGYGWINEFKEFCFEPEATGSRQGQYKAICSKDGVSVSETKNLVIFKINVEKQPTRTGYLQQIANAYNTMIKILREYDI